MLVNTTTDVFEISVVIVVVIIFVAFVKPCKYIFLQ